MRILGVGCSVKRKYFQEHLAFHLLLPKGGAKTIAFTSFG
jgi:hypothetical protein